MSTRQVTLRVVCDLPEDVSVMELKEYIQEALKARPGDPPINTKLLNSMKILGKYKRKVS